MNSARRLIFRWPERNVSFLFPLFFLLALLLHATGFLLFQVVYPPSENAQIAPPGKVTFVSPTTSEGRAFLQWVEAQNPVSSLTPLLEAIPKGLGEVKYIPSYASVRSLPKTVESFPATGPEFPSARSHHALLQPTASSEETAPAPHAALPTRLTFSSSLQTRAYPPTPTDAPMPSSPAANFALALPPTKFLVAVDSDGTPLYLFLQESSGNTLLDREAEEHLSRQRFTTAPESATETWGFATYTWGADALKAPEKTAPSGSTSEAIPEPASPQPAAITASPQPAAITPSPSEELSL